MKRESTLVPYLIEEKVAVFFESVAYAYQALRIATRKDTKGLHTCEKGVRRALESYPLGVSGLVLDAEKRARLMAADCCVLSAWHALRPSVERETKQWDTIIKLLSQAGERIGEAYELPYDRTGIVRLGDLRKPGTRRALALSQIEPFRIRQMYK